MPFSSSEEEAGIRRRLADVSRRYSQAEIARRLGMRRGTVSRYLSQNRIPGAFLAGIAREFGVNATWLMLGEGAPWIADVRADQANMGRGMMEMVQAMARVSRLRLGALAGRQDAKDLRELNDALEAYERLRRRMAEQSRPTYAKILQDWRQALGRGEMAQARHLRAAAEQVARICPDPLLEIEHENLRGGHEYTSGNVEGALPHMRRAVLGSLPATGEMDEKTFSAAFRVVMTLEVLGRTRDAARYAEAALALAPPHAAAEWASYPLYRGFYGWVLVLLDDVVAGLPLLTQAMTLVAPGPGLDNLRVSAAYALFISGALSLAAVAGDAEASPSVVRRLLFLSPWCLEAEPVRRLLARDRRAQSDERFAQKQRLARAHLHALEGRHPQALREWEAAEREEAAASGGAGAPHFAGNVMRCQLWRLAGDITAARRALAKAEQVRHDTPPEIQLDFNWRRIHWRNAAALATGSGPRDMELRDLARGFARYARERGLVAHPAP